MMQILPNSKPVLARMYVPKFAYEVALLLASLGLWTITRATIVTASFGSRNSASPLEKENLETSQRTSIYQARATRRSVNCASCRSIQTFEETQIKEEHNLLPQDEPFVVLT